MDMISVKAWFFLSYILLNGVCGLYLGYMWKRKLLGVLFMIIGTLFIWLVLVIVWGLYLR